jgi:putative SOS response-associated peptidase YedK
MRITRPPNAIVAPIHNRMLVVLDKRAADKWMNPLERYPFSLRRLFIPELADALVASPASLFVNRVKNDDPELLVARV